ncbi:hypothetical protein [Helicobacter pylori]|uniref:hypothetical protein n=1 Tax=Helicobacter pylori TaxID=210 RepID=UPI00046CB421|nr:hypothetical protein [Helicobacter pylori]
MEQEKLKPIDLEVLNALCKKEYEKENNYFKVCILNDLGKELCAYLKALKHAKNTRKAQQ